MASEVAYEAVKRIHENNYPIENKILRNLKDQWTQGLTLQRCYERHWDEIKDCVDRLDLELRDITPVLTLNEYRNVLEVERLLGVIYRHLKHDIIVTERDFKRRLFIPILLAHPIYCEVKSSESFEKFITQESNYKSVLSISGTILEKEAGIRELLKE